MMTREFATAVRLVIATVVICCVVYPVAILAFAMVAAPEKRLGSLIEGRHGAPVGSRLVAQAFRRPEYFWPRPSAVGYDASAAGGSNLSPHNPAVGRALSPAMAASICPSPSSVWPILRWLLARFSGPSHVLPRPVAPRRSSRLVHSLQPRRDQGSGEDFLPLSFIIPRFGKPIVQVE